MYHISKDLRAKKSAEKIGKGLLSCLKNKNFIEITITDIQKSSSISRATFYRLFDNIYDVLSYLCDNLFEKVNKQFKSIDNYNTKTTSLKFIQELMNNKSLLSALLNCNRMDILYYSHLKYISKNINYFFPNSSINKEQTNYLILTMTSLISSFLTAWLKNGSYETAEQIQTRLKNSLKILSNIF